MIVIRLKGGLGNQMFQYALGRILSIKNRTDLAFNIEAYIDQTPRPFNPISVHNFYLDVFNVAGRIAKKNEIPIIYRMYRKGKIMLLIDAVRRRIFRHKAQELSFEKFNPQMLELGPNVYLDGYFQSPKYFIGFEDILRKDFIFKKKFQENIQKLSEEILELDSLCVHVRRGDYVGNKFHEVIGIDYYINGIEYILKTSKITKIYVFSDDIEWCKNNISFKFPTMFVDNTYAGVKSEGHLFLMSKCKNFIIPNSTFSWWAVWLSENKKKVVIAPKYWFGDKSIDTSDLIPEEWIRI